LPGLLGSLAFGARLSSAQRHAIECFTRLCFAHVNTSLLRGLLIPTRQAIAAKASEVHHINVLHIWTILDEMVLQAAEGGGFKVSF
jgi:hypothetical protein